ncbi:MAG: flippase-like domain-containing protein [Bacteroidales bacterium]|nr:flippase-like domain-containing protein [Bacteroidales bacterium]MCF8334446.1 flippase-like domain-containing protein [Bacteroidales bacterium]
MVAKTKVKKTWNILIKIFIVIAAYGFLYYQLFHEQKGDHIARAFENYSESAKVLWSLAAVLLLMLVNWSIEAFKWRYLLNKEEEVPFTRSFKAVFAGITVSIFTPNRTGEFLGRVFILKKTNPWKAIFITIVGSFSQLMATLVVGYISFVIFAYRFWLTDLYVSDYLFTGIAVFVGIMVFLLLLLYLNVRVLDPVLRKLINSRWKKIGQYFSVFSRFNTSKLIKVFGLSLLRYLVFTFQFILLLQAFKVPVNVFEGIMLVSVLFFIMTAIPTITLAELGIRGSVIISVFNIFFENTGIFTEAVKFGVFAASSGVWLFNLALPALIGTIFIFQLRFFKKRNNS